jgi:predicted nuclease with RNAse H fold
MAGHRVRTLGIDLSANPLKTGACEVDWDAGTVRLLPRPTEDEALVEAVQRADLTGIDIPLGWPDAFVDAVTAHHRGDDWPPVDLPPPVDRVALSYRATDLASIERGARPLSVSTDRIGVATMRGARLQHLLHHAGAEVDRSGTRGAIAEVYPAAALRHWGLTRSGYKGRANASVCRALAAEVASGCGRLADAVATCLTDCDDDALDAFLCAVIARAVLQGQTTRPDEDQLPVARREGWIHAPTGELAAIVA